MIENFAEDEKRGFFSARSWNRTVVFFCLACFFCCLTWRKNWCFRLSPLFLFMGCFRIFFVSAVQVLA